MDNDSGAVTDEIEIAEQKRIQEKAKRMTKEEIDSEGHRPKEKLDKNAGNYQAEFVDDKEYLASAGGGRSFKHLNDEVDKKHQKAQSDSDNCDAETAPDTDS